MVKKAVIFGIDYLNTPSRLYGCSRDAINMQSFFLEKLHFDTVDVYTEQTNPSAVTMQGMLSILLQLVKDSFDPNVSIIAIHYSGHGSNTVDMNRDEGEDGLDEMIVPVDHSRSGFIVDDWIQIILSKMCKDVTVICTFDSCHSGTICDLRYRLSPDGIVTENNRVLDVECNVISISGCMDNQYSYDAYNVGNVPGYSGAMTTCFIDTITNHLQINTHVNVIQLVSDLRDLLTEYEFPQTPIITSSKYISATTTIY